MSKNFISFVVVILIFFLGTNLFAQEKIAFIDLNFVYSNSKIGKKIIKEISNKQENINKDFKDFQNKLDKEKEKLLSQKRKDLIDYQNKSKNEFIKKLQSTLQKYASENSLSLILRKEQILIGSNQLDVTKDILELVNKS